MIKKIKKFFLLFFFCCFVNSLGAEREIPHTIVTENPKKKVTEIQTLKKYKEKAELNITVTKIKTEYLPVQVDKRRQKIFAKFDGMEDKIIYAVEKPEDIPNPQTATGRIALNKKRYRRSALNEDGNLDVHRYELRTGQKKTKIEIDYRELPKDLYFVVEGNSGVDKIYRANYTNYSAIYGRNVNVKLWLFGQEVESSSNVVLDYSNNGTGDIELRSNGAYNALNITA